MYRLGCRRAGREFDDVVWSRGSGTSRVMALKTSTHSRILVYRHTLSLINNFSTFSIRPYRLYLMLTQLASNSKSHS